LKKETSLIIIIIFLLICSCVRDTKPEMTSPDEEFEQAVKCFEEGNYKKALNYLKYFFNRYPGSHWIDDAQFYYAESYYQLQEYTEAMNEFQFLINNFPNSNWSEKGLLRTAQCMEKMSPIAQREQTLTKEAIDTYEEFIKRYPYSQWLDEAKESKRSAEEKLNQKLVEIGETYIKMGIHGAAIAYLKKAADQSEQWKDKANFLLGDIALSDNNDSLAIFYYQQVEGEFKEKAQKKLEKIK